MSYDGFEKYDRDVARSYDQDRQGEAHWQAEFAWLSAFAARHPLGRVVDVPVGTGRLLTAMKSAQQITGLDVSEDMLQVARSAAAAAGHLPVELMRGDALDMPFSDAAFETVVCFRLTHLLPPELIPSLLAELSRVCAARILLQVYVAKETPPRPRFARWLARLVRRVVPARKLPWSHIRSYQYTWRFFEDALVGAGLTLTARHRIDDYGASSVEVLELAK